MEHMDSKEMRLAEAEHAVIKAAVAWRRSMRWGDLDDDRHHYLNEAVEAYEKAKGE